MEHLLLFSFSLIVFSTNLYFLALLWFSDKQNNQVRSLMAMGIATCYWTIFDAVAGVAQSYAYAYMYTLRSVMLVIAPCCFLLYILYLSESKLPNKRVFKAVFFTIPIIDIILVLSNPIHRLIFSADGFPLPEYGPLFVFHAAVAYLAILFGMIMLFRYILQKRPPLGFAIGWTIACVVPVVVNVLFTIGVINMDQDIAPFAFAVIFILFSLYSYRSRLSNLKASALSDVFDSYADAVVLINADDIIEEANLAFKSYFLDFKLTPQVTKASNLFDYFSANASDDDSRSTLVRFQREKSVLEKQEISLCNADGEPSTFTVNRQGVHANSGRLTGWLLTLSDVSVYRKMIQEINQQNEHLAILREKAEAASDAKSTFLANMSHEMRTPLNAIIGLSELALRRNTDAETRASIVKVHESGVNLLSVINDILDISKIESGHFELALAEYSTADLINEAVAVNRVRIGIKPLKFVLRVDQELPAKLLGDELRVRQIFNNLLSNAIKYSQEGVVSLDVSARPTSNPDGGPGGNTLLIIKVSDTGRGIKPEDIPNLFIEYQQLDMKASRAVEGTGLGLSITQHLTQMMGGSIQVDSTFGEGSVFTVSIVQQNPGTDVLGLAVVQDLADFNYTANRREEQSEGFFYTQMPYANVLVVDDVEVNLEVARGMLEPYDIQVDCLDSGEAAVKAITAGMPQYNLVFMDQMMPGMDGLEAVRIIRGEIGSKYAQEIPIVALTANAMAGSKEMFLQAGFQDFLAKPIDYKALDAILVRWIADRVR